MSCSRQWCRAVYQLPFNWYYFFFFYIRRISFLTSKKVSVCTTVTTTLQACRGKEHLSRICRIVSAHECTSRNEHAAASEWRTDNFFMNFSKRTVAVSRRLSKRQVPKTIPRTGARLQRKKHVGAELALQSLTGLERQVPPPAWASLPSITLGRLASFGSARQKAERACWRPCTRNTRPAVLIPSETIVGKAKMTFSLSVLYFSVSRFERGDSMVRWGGMTLAY